MEAAPFIFKPINLNFIYRGFTKRLIFQLSTTLFDNDRRENPQDISINARIYNLDEDFNLAKVKVKADIKLKNIMFNPIRDYLAYLPANISLASFKCKKIGIDLNILMNSLDDIKTKGTISIESLGFKKFFSIILKEDYTKLNVIREMNGISAINLNLAIPLHHSEHPSIHYDIALSLKENKLLFRALPLAFSGLKGGIEINKDILTIHNIEGKLGESSIFIDQGWIKDFSQEDSAVEIDVKSQLSPDDLFKIINLNLKDKVKIDQWPLCDFRISGNPAKIKLIASLDLTKSRYAYGEKIIKPDDFPNNIYFQGQINQEEGGKLFTLDKGLVNLGSSKGLFNGNIHYLKGKEIITFDFKTEELLWSELEKLFVNYKNLNRFATMKVIEGSGIIETSKKEGGGEDKKGQLKLLFKDGIIKKSTILTDIFSFFNRILNFKVVDFSTRGLSYKTMSADFIIDNSNFTTQNFFIKSDDLIITGIGTINLENETVDAVLAVQPLHSLEKYLNKVPLLGWILTGKEKQIVVAYFKVEGRFESPKIEPVSWQSLPKGVFNILHRTLKLPLDFIKKPKDVVLPH
ncbi:MAG: AsmA-like C-terminal domain-containing protein [bacterium]